MKYGNSESNCFTQERTNNLSKCRPIFILPTFWKGSEKILYTQITTFKKESTLSISQYGFRPKKNTKMAQMAQKELMVNWLEHKLCTLGIFIYFTKAFDHLNRCIPIQKLGQCGIRGIASYLTKSHLQHCKQYVYHNTSTSSTAQIRNRVPQGSTLGSLLFITYTSNIFGIPHFTTFLTYADDTSVFLTGTNPDKIVTTAANSRR